MNKLRALFHPIFVFIGVQIAWIILIAVWANWYLKNNRNLQELARKFRPDLFNEELDWVILVEGGFLMLIILAGVYVIFVYWNKQARLNKLQSSFISSVSHELKSPLASIQLYLETLKYREVSKKETCDFVDTMLLDTERLSWLVENILESSKSGYKTIQLQFQPVDVVHFLREVVDGHKRQFEEKNVHVHLRLEETPILNLDKRAMRLVFNNLLGNALRYSPVGSDLVIRVSRGKKYCEIQVTDQGIGLDKKDRKKIFKRFYRVQNKETQNIEGAGLGLFIASEFVKGHKGFIEVFSEGRGKGATFTVGLPISKQTEKSESLQKQSA